MLLLLLLLLLQLLYSQGGVYQVIIFVLMLGVWVVAVVDGTRQVQLVKVIDGFHVVHIHVRRGCIHHSFIWVPVDGVDTKYLLCSYCCQEHYFCWLKHLHKLNCLKCL